VSWSSTSGGRLRRAGKPSGRRLVLVGFFGDLALSYLGPLLLTDAEAPGLAIDTALPEVRPQRSTLFLRSV
jgi:hypothetical protein